MKGLYALIVGASVLTGSAVGTRAGASGGVQAAVTTYAATQVTPPSGFDNLIVTDMNNSGQLCGRARKTSDMAFHALRRTGTTWEDLGTGTALALNDSGVCVGFDEGAGAVKWAGGVRTVIPGHGFATDINGAGAILAPTNNPAGSAPTIVNPDSTETPIPPLSTMFPSFTGRAINSSGQVTGSGQFVPGQLTPFRYSSGATVDLNGGVGDVAFGTGEAINDDGTVCGFFEQPSSGRTLAGVWTGPGSLTILETPGTQGSYALSINNGGTVVGQLFDGATSTAAMWTGGAFKDLNSLTTPSGLALSSANRITTAGVILAHRHVPGSGSVYYILTPASATPLPDLRGVFGAVASKCTGTGARRQCSLSGKITVTNGGSVKNKPAKLAIFSSTDAGIGGDTLLKTLTIPALGPGSSKVLQLSGAKLARGASATGLFLIGLIDQPNAVAESDEGNNSLVSTALP